MASNRGQEYRGNTEDHVTLVNKPRGLAKINKKQQALAEQMRKNKEAKAQKEKLKQEAAEDAEDEASSSSVDATVETDPTVKQKLKASIHHPD